MNKKNNLNKEVTESDLELSRLLGVTVNAKPKNRRIKWVGIGILVMFFGGLVVQV